VVVVVVVVGMRYLVTEETDIVTILDALVARRCLVEGWLLMMRKRRSDRGDQ